MQSASLLAIDTSFSACSAAVRNARSGAVACRFERMEIGHAERLVPMIAEVMAEAGLGFADLDAVAATVGPGTFTGVRIAIAAARGLCLAHALKSVPVSSLAVMAAGVSATSPTSGEIAIAMDARRGRVFLQRFAAHGAPLGEPVLATVEFAAQMLGSEPALIAGSGALAVMEAGRPLRRADHAVLADLLPSASYVLQMKGLSADLLVPAYLRPPDAKPPAGSSLRRAP